MSHSAPDVSAINLHHRRPPAPGAQRIAVHRPSVLGNPFTIGPDGDRLQVIEQYRGHSLMTYATKVLMVAFIGNAFLAIAGALTIKPHPPAHHRQPNCALTP